MMEETSPPGQYRPLKAGANRSISCLRGQIELPDQVLNPST